MGNQSIKEQALGLVQEYRTHDPFLIARQLGIKVYEPELGRLLGMYTIIQRQRCIFVNRDLNDHQKKIICAHELGHDLLHRKMLKQIGVMQEFTLMDLNTQSEIEANRFAAHLLLDEEQIMEMIQYGYSDQEIASKLCVNLNLLLIKLRDMQKEYGLDFNLSHIPPANFMGKFEEKRS